MLLPRVGLFRTMKTKNRHGAQINQIHVVLVTGDTHKTFCTRQQLRNGEMIEPEEVSGMMCRNCQNSGWIRNLGALGASEKATSWQQPSILRVSSLSQ